MPDRPRPAGTAPRGKPASAARRPSKATFRRRRLVALVALVVVIGLIAWAAVALLGGGSGASPSSPTTPETAPATAAVASGAASAEAEDPAATPTATTEPRERVSDYPLGATPPPPIACPAEWTEFTVTAPDSTPPGSPVPFTVHLTVAADGDPCFIDLGSDSLSFTVYGSDDAVVWSSRTCAFAPASQRLLLPVDGVETTTVRWNGYPESQGCATPQQPGAEAGGEGAEDTAPGSEPAPPGTYKVVAQHLLDAETLQAETVFLVG